ncbi:peptidoglycan DD-metalloendopeptidase family protein [Brevibacillus ruminantium]|uniref:Peptidoglycan DD-metalloendopeptidase family protein n=1 Tax=Brevibacillus ruminantium TaxID=2950604 RepID=A0ABY4WQ78_9BACL|nr:M56 family metallopeptidase [Brevibacillus ruminantium]USG68303.1 peptidoglycan DD-metalloendopeptidase family protein [Brevibacillus ruminantium]
MESLRLLLEHSFVWVLTNSLQASILVGLILLCKLAGRGRLTVKWHDAIWFLLILKLAIPWSPGSPMSLFNWLPAWSGAAMPFDTTVAAPPIYIERAGLPLSGDLTLQQSSTSLLGTDSLLLSLLAVIWFCGALILLITVFCQARRFSSRLKQEPLVEEQWVLDILAACKHQMNITKPIRVIKSRSVTSPMLTGLWQPQIVLPEKSLEILDKQELQHVILHELSHWKRRDIAVNSLMSFLLIWNWFNPLLWYAASRMRRDQEIACDALALTYMKESEVKSYGYTMIKLLEMYAKQRNTAFTAGFSSSKNELKRRMYMIRSFRKNAYSWTTSGVIIAIVLGVVTLTSGQKAAGEPLHLINPVEGSTAATSEPFLLIPPVEGKITSTFRDARNQDGIVIVNNASTPVQAAAAGTVIQAEYSGKAGNQIIIQHEAGYQTVYSHLEKLEVTSGTAVAQGQLIGLLGSTGRSTGPHLYFELHRDGQPVDPLPFMSEATAKE